MNDHGNEQPRDAGELRAERLLRAGVVCVALFVLLLFLPRLVGAVGPGGSGLAAVAASVLGFWARVAAPKRSPARGTGLVLGLVGLTLAIVQGFFVRGGP